MSEPGLLDLPNQVLGLASGTMNFFDSIYAKVEAIKRKKLSSQNYLRAYYFEVINNLELLHVVNVNKFKDVDVGSDLFKKFINRLDTQIGATILFTEEIDEKTELYKLLKTKGRLENKKNMIQTYVKGIESNFPGKVLYENILQAISFTVVKIELLKRLSAMDPDEKAYLNKIVLAKRILNIQERLVMIKNIMDQMDGIKDISR